jgi:hypothetical protein
MNTGTMSTSGEYSLYIGQVYQRHNARLRSNFLSQLGDETEADECLQETLRHFFFFMQDRCWESEAHLVDVYVMRIAGAVCSRRLARKRALAASAPEQKSLLERLGREALKPVQASAALKQLFLRTFANAGQPSLEQLSALR